jgi:branched-chain amino acid aminotransferase
MKVFLNGELIEEEEAKVSIFDHGFLYGDGIFEGIRSYDGLVFRLKQHLDRLFESAHTIMLKIPYKREQLQEAIIQTLKANNLRDAYIRLVVSRGKGDLGLDPRKCKSPNIIIITDKIVLYPKQIYQNGIELITVPTRRNIVEALNPQLKSLNYLNNILAKIEAINSGVEEAIMLNNEGYVVECSGDNIFILKDGVLITPPIYLGALEGITRQVVMEIAVSLNIKVEEKAFTRHEVFNSFECFLTGTAAEIVPVVKVDGRQINDGKPGKITIKLMEEYRKLTRSESEGVKVI